MKQIWIIAVTGLWLLGGCAFINDIRNNFRNQKSVDADYLTLKRAEQALKNGENEKAMETYRMLSQLARNEKIRRQALYGLACAQLISAETPDEMEASITLWDAWGGLLPDTLNYEDPRLIKSLLEQKMQWKREVLEKQSIVEPKVIAPSPGEAIIKEKNKEITKLRSRVTMLEREIQTLEHQLQSLEAIDQKMQEKKKEIASP